MGKLDFQKLESMNIARFELLQARSIWKFELILHLSLELI